MNQRVIFFVILVVTATALHATVLFKKNRAGAVAKYDIKSGIITYDRLNTQQGATTHTKEIVYFDDYGITEAYEVYDLATGAPTLASGRYGKGDFTCSYDMNTMRADCDSYDSGGVFLRFDLKEGSAALKKDERYAEIAGDTICGKFCDGVSCTPAPDGAMKFFGYHHIMMKMISEYPALGNNMILVATSLEENVPIPPEKFSLPPGVRMASGK